ncbi:hypothetical protein U9M48_037071 [Paspalum notatum var. saurae]|uniref:F-box/LRR-repeat protein 15/At3g58940/PEG3-like LRR domain-containing protein n=1 Tax=Paspalum notatum var. saurae TaxID=547442 RepID=A0AAQ3UE86_PASNO
MTRIETQGHEHQDDRLNNLPDDILLFMLDKLRQLHDAVRTTVLSKRWRHLLDFRLKIFLDVLDYINNTDDDSCEYTISETNASMVVGATRSVLERNRRRPAIDLLIIRFFLRDESIDIVRAVDEAMGMQRILTAEFVIIPEVPNIDCTDGDMIMLRKTLHCLRLGEADIHGVLSACSRLEYLRLERCDAGTDPSILQIEHSRLEELVVIFCGFESVELKRLPRLTHLTCKYWWPSSQDQYPLSMGYVPNLEVLQLTNTGTTMVGELDLNFLCERPVWIQPEGPKRLAPLLQNLRVVTLRFIDEEYDLMWTLFILEAASFLNELNMEISYHTCYPNDEEECNQNYIPREKMCQKEFDFLKWEAHNDFKHYNMTKLAIEGFQVEEKFTRFTRRVMEAAVNLECISLLESCPCLLCGFLPSTIYPRTQKERDLIKNQFLAWRSSPIQIDFDV